MNIMNKVRITAIRQTVYEDLMAKYENPIEHTCDVTAGQQWVSINGQCPDGMCPSAWESMRPFVESLARGDGNFYDGWMKNPMSAMISCNDGFRPFSFYIEVMNETILMETERLILRPWQDSDAEALYKYASDPDVGPRAGWPPHKSVEESLEIIRTIFHNDRTWAIELKETGEPIGCIGYFIYGESNINIGENDAEAGYWIAKPYWNQGICTEALRWLIDYCFNEKKFDVLWSDFFVDNPASGRVMEKCGFRDTGEINYCSKLQVGNDRPVKVMNLRKC